MTITEEYFNHPAHAQEVIDKASQAEKDEELAPIAAAHGLLGSVYTTMIYEKEIDLGADESSEEVIQRLTDQERSAAEGLVKRSPSKASSRLGYAVLESQRFAHEMLSTGWIDEVEHEGLLADLADVRHRAGCLIEQTLEEMEQVDREDDNDFPLLVSV